MFMNANWKKLFLSCFWLSCRVLKPCGFMEGGTERERGAHVPPLFSKSPVGVCVRNVWQMGIGLLRSVGPEFLPAHTGST